MKSIKNIWGLAVAMLAATTLYSCGNEEADYTPAEAEGAVAHITFAGGSTSTFEVEPGNNSFELTLQRDESKAASAETVNLIVTENGGNIFNCPSSVNFAAGQTEASFTVTVSGAEEGVYYNLSILADGNLSNYTQGDRQKDVTFAIMKWESIGTGLWVGNAVGAFFGVEQLPLAVQIEKAVTSTSTRFRFANPYEITPDYADYPIDDAGKYYYYKGYPYNDPAEIVPVNSTFVIICDAKGVATLNPVNMGMDWGYGMFSTGSILGNLSDDVTKYTNGTYSANGGYVKFPASSLYCRMANYGARVCGDEAYLYTSFDAFLNNQTKEPDYENDFTWQSVEGAMGTFVSSAVNDKWVQDFEAAYDAATGELTEGLYRFPDLYVEGYPIVVTLTQDQDKYLISTPKAQFTGMVSLGNQYVYAEIKSGSCNISDMQMTLNVALYTMDENGNKVVDFGTMTEEFQWGKTGVKYEDLKGHNLADYVGYWVVPLVDKNIASVGKSLLSVAPSSTKENTLVISGLSAIDPSKYNDDVEVEWSPKTGLLTLNNQWTADYGSYNVQLAFLDIETGYFFIDGEGISMVGGLTEDGVLAFVGNPANEYSVQTVRYIAFNGGNPYSWLNSYFPYPLECDAYTATRSNSTFSAAPKLTPIEKSAAKSVKQHSLRSDLQGRPFSARNIVKGNFIEVR